jgi:hypothetical protein
MIATYNKYAHLVSETGQNSAMQMLRDIPRDGRTYDQHFYTVWCVCGDYFGWDWMVYVAKATATAKKHYLVER